MKKLTLTLIVMLAALLFCCPAGAAGLVNLKASYSQIGEYDCGTPKGPFRSQGFDIPGPGTLVVKLWVKPHVERAALRRIRLTVGRASLMGYLKSTFHILTVDGSSAKGPVDGRPFYAEDHYKVEKALKNCKVTIQRPDSGCQQWKQMVEVTLEYYPPGVTPPRPGKADTPKPSSADQAEKWYQQGLSAIRQKKYPQAVDLLSKALRTGKLSAKKQANAYYQRGWAQGKLGKRAQALADVEKAIKLNPKNSVYHHMRGWWLMKHKRYQEALQECRIALRQNPNSPFAYHTLSRTYEEMGECQKALATAQKALSLKPGNQGLKNNLARLRKKGCGGAKQAAPSASKVGYYQLDFLRHYNMGRPEATFKVDGIPVSGYQAGKANVVWLTKGKAPCCPKSTFPTSYAWQVPSYTAKEVLIATNLAWWGNSLKDKPVVRLTVEGHGARRSFDLKVGQHTAEWNGGAITPAAGVDGRNRHSGAVKTLVHRPLPAGVYQGDQGQSGSLRCAAPWQRPWRGGDPWHYLEG